MTTFPH